MKNGRISLTVLVLSILVTACNLPVPTVQATPTLAGPAATATAVPRSMASITPRVVTATPTVEPTAVAPITQPIEILWNGVATDLQFNKIVVTTAILKLDGTLAHAKPGFWFVTIKGISWQGAKNIENWPDEQVFATDNNNNVYPWKYRCVLTENTGNVCWGFETPVGSLLKEITLPGDLIVSLKPFWNLQH